MGHRFSTLEPSQPTNRHWNFKPRVKSESSRPLKSLKSPTIKPRLFLLRTKCWAIAMRSRCVVRDRQTTWAIARQTICRSVWLHCSCVSESDCGPPCWLIALCGYANIAMKTHTVPDYCKMPSYAPSVLEYLTCRFIYAMLLSLLSLASNSIEIIVKQGTSRAAFVSRDLS